MLDRHGDLHDLQPRFFLTSLDLFLPVKIYLTILELSFLISLREKCPNMEFFWSVFSCIRNEYRDLRSKSLYSVRTQGKTDQKKLRIWTVFTQCIVTSDY